jgi:cell division protein FtsZ
MEFDPPLDELMATPVEPQPRVVTKIVDPSVADEEELEPLFPKGHFDEDRARKGGWLSLFGRPRQSAAPRPTLRSVASAPAPAPASEEGVDDADDLEIPSFLRRLAN